MNRRSFFHRLAVGVAAITAAPSILPAATTYARRWARPAPEKILWVPNPAYLRATHEIRFLIQDEKFSPVLLNRLRAPWEEPPGLIPESVPIRFNAPLDTTLADIPSPVPCIPPMIPENAVLPIIFRRKV